MAVVTKSGAKTAPVAKGRGKTKIPEPAKPLKPAQCRGFMRKHLAEAFPKIVEGFVNQAETGSCMHVKLASELLESKRKTAGGAGSRKNSAREVLRQWDRDAARRQRNDERRDPAQLTPYRARLQRSVD